MVFVDAANPFYGAKQEISQKAHFDAVSTVEDLISGRNCVGIRFYDGDLLWDNENADMHEDIEKRGYELVLRKQSYNSKKKEGSTQKEVDVKMALEMYIMAKEDKYDVAIVVSGDRDFLPAIEEIKACGKKVIVAAFKSELSRAMEENCDEFIDLCKVPCIKIVSGEYRYGTLGQMIELSSEGVVNA